MSTRTQLFTIAALASLAFTTACDTDYVTYRVASASTSMQADCYPDGVPDSIKDDLSTIKAASSMYIFEGPEGARYLEFGDVALEGTLDSGVMSFGGMTLDVEYPSDEIETRSEVTHDVSITKEGKFVTGTYTLTTNVTCIGDADLCDAVPTGICTSTTEFTGSRVSTELKREL